MRDEEPISLEPQVVAIKYAEKEEGGEKEEDKDIEDFEIEKLSFGSGSEGIIE